MWKKNTSITLSAIIVGLRHPECDLKAMASWAHALSNELRNSINPRLVPRIPVRIIDGEIAKVVSELEHLESAVNDLNMAKALQHAETALRLVAAETPEMFDAAGA